MMFQSPSTIKATIITLIFFGFLTSASAGGYEKKLLKDILSFYNTLERPVLNESLPVNVNLGITLLNLIEVNMEQQYMTANMWLTMKWNDENLRWNATEYGNISSLNIPPHRVWIPDIYVYNSLHPDFDPTFQTKLVVLSNGSVTYVTPGIFKTSCKTDAMHYPFDEQKCTIKFGSWTSDSAQIDLELYSKDGTGDLTNYVRNSEWELLGMPGKRNAIYYACCPDAYVDIAFVVHLKRHGEAIFCRLSFALSFGAIAMVFSFLIPPSSGQRISLGIVNFLAVLALGVSVQINAGQSTAMAFLFSRLALLIFVSILSNVFIVYLHNLNPSLHRMPVWLRKIVFDVIPPFILLNRPVKDEGGGASAISTGGNEISDNRSTEQDYNNEEVVSDLQALVVKIRAKAKQNRSYNINDWQYFAMVLDRIIFLLFGITSIAFLIMYFCAFA